MDRNIHIDVVAIRAYLRRKSERIDQIDRVSTDIGIDVLATANQTLQ